MELELLQSFYQELSELIGEESMLVFHTRFQGLTLHVPKKLYSGEKIKKLLKKRLAEGELFSCEERQKLARKFDYSERQIVRFLE